MDGQRMGDEETLRQAQGERVRPIMVSLSNHEPTSLRFPVSQSCLPNIPKLHYSNIPKETDDV